MRCRLGGYVILPRLLDKCRASLIGKLGDYKYDCPLDQHFFRFTGIDAEAFKVQVAPGLGDWEILQWIQSEAPLRREPWEILQWSEYHDRRGPDSDRETLDYFASALVKFSAIREDIRTWADLLDLDDFVSFGGKA